MLLSPSTNPTVYQARGSLVRVDTFNRELTLLVGGAVLDLDVPPSCAIVLNGQAVRLRLLQPQDRLLVAYEPGLGRGIARRIDVNTF
jgi:hypothetical protein